MHVFASLPPLTASGPDNRDLVYRLSSRLFSRTLFLFDFPYAALGFYDDLGP